MTSWTRRYWYWWLILAIGAGFGLPELVALVDGDPATQPLTNWIGERGLAGIAAAVGAWLAIHFGGRSIMQRPAETITAAAGAIFGALQVIIGAASNGFDFTDLQDPEVTGAITIIGGFVAAAVTWYVARKQRATALRSAPDGAVLPAVTT